MAAWARSFARSSFVLNLIVAEVVCSSPLAAHRLALVACRPARIVIAWSLLV